MQQDVQADAAYNIQSLANNRPLARSFTLVPYHLQKSSINNWNTTYRVVLGKSFREQRKPSEKVFLFSR